MDENVTQESTGPHFELGSVNVDSLKDVLNQIGVYLAFSDEASKVAYHEQVNGLDAAGDPHAPVSEATTAELSDAEARIAELEAQLAAAQHNPDNSGGAS